MLGYHYVPQFLAFGQDNKLQKNACRYPLPTVPFMIQIGLQLNRLTVIKKGKGKGKSRIRIRVKKRNGQQSVQKFNQTKKNDKGLKIHDFFFRWNEMLAFELSFL
jgi:hypothetical protein